MKKILVLVVMLAVLFVSALAAFADTEAEKFKKIRIVDDVIVSLDIEGDVLDQAALKEYALNAFKDTMRGMIVNNDAWVDNYAAKGYVLEEIGYILIKIMSIRTKGGMNVYHLDFEFGVPPRTLYWDTSIMGVAPTTLDMNKEVKEDIDEVMKEFADSFYKLRGE